MKFRIKRYLIGFNEIEAKNRKEALKIIQNPNFKFNDTEYQYIKTTIKKVIK